MSAKRILPTAAESPDEVKDAMNTVLANSQILTSNPMDELAAGATMDEIRAALNKLIQERNT